MITGDNIDISTISTEIKYEEGAGKMLRYDVNAQAEKRSEQFNTRITPSLMNRINEIKEKTGLEGQGLIEKLVNDARISEAVKKDAVFADYLSKIERYSNAMIDVVNSVIKSAIDMQKLNEDEHEKEVKSLKKKNEELEEKLEEKLKSLAELKEKVESFNEKEADFNRLLAEKEKEIEELKSDKETLKSNVHDKSAEIARLNKTIALLNAKLEEAEHYTKETKDLKESNFNLKTKVSLLENKNKNLIDKVEFYKNEIKDIRKDKDRAENKIDKIEEKLEKIRAELASEKNKNIKYESEVNTLKKELEEVRRKKQQKSEKI